MQSALISVVNVNVGEMSVVVYGATLGVASATQDVQFRFDRTGGLIGGAELSYIEKS